MWFFSYAADRFGSLESKFEDIADRIEGVPLVGRYLAGYFDSVAWYCSTIEGYFDSASEWADTVFSSGYAVFQALTGYLEDGYDILQKEWSDVTGYVSDEIAKIEIPELPTWSDIFENVRGFFEIKYDMLTTTLSTISDFIDVDLNISGVWTWINNSSVWFTNSLSSAKNTIVGFIIDRFEYILDEVFKE